jgi:histidinol dehydrogenase
MRPAVETSSNGANVFAVVGDAASLTAAQRRRLFDRGRATDPDVERETRAIIDAVRARGDDALRELALRYDGARLDVLEVPRTVWEGALADLDPAVRSALEHAAANIRAFHTAQLPAPLEIETQPGVRLGRRADPLRSVGVYAPGGRASYPSSVLMGVVPAKVAGVQEIVVCSPPAADGLPPAAVLAACALAGADRVFAVGGAGAIAALACGTASVPRVDRIVGPGNAWVTEAKRQLNGVVGIDSPAGPSEVLILADDAADAALIAAELLAQAEHDPDAAAVLVTTDAALVEQVARRVDAMLPEQPRADIIAAALRARGALLTAADLDEASALANAYAPEHLLVMTREPRTLLPRLRAAGTIFLGAPSSVAFGDYITGANHVLPTAGLARFYSGLSTLDFVRWTTYQELTTTAAAQLAAPTAALAVAEGLPAHALCAQLCAEDALTAARAQHAAAQAVRPGAALVLRAAYVELAPYDPGRAPCAVDLSDNTNLFGVAPAAAAAVRATTAPQITRYPQVYADELRAVLAARYGVEPANVATGCGSDDVIDSALRALAEPGDTVTYTEPTFGMVPVFARMNALRPLAVAAAPGLQLDAAALLGTGARVTYICRPNNPTGIQYDRRRVEQVCTESAGLVLIDEAYADFADDDMLQFAAASERTIVIRTLSKAFGLAGLRVGFAIGPPVLIAEIEKSRGPYKVSGVGAAAALAVLRADDGWVADRVAEARRNRERLSGELRRRGLAVPDSAANFVLIPVGDAARCSARLRGAGVAVRPFRAVPELGDAIRVSIGPWPLLERFLTAFDEAGSP